MTLNTIPAGVIPLAGTTKPDSFQVRGQSMDEDWANIFIIHMNGVSAYAS